MRCFPSDSDGAVVVVLTSHMDELATIVTARRFADSLRARLVGCWAATGPATPLLDELAGGAFDGWLPRSGMHASLAGGRLRGIVVSGKAWNRLGDDLWRHVSRTPICVARRDPGPRQRILVAADSIRSGRMLLRHIRGYPVVREAHVWVAHAINPYPLWLLAASTVGYFDPTWLGSAPEFVKALREEAAHLDLQPLLLHGPAGEALNEAIRQIHPDVVLLGWRRHLLPNPRLAHPTAWRISHRADVDVMLYDLGQGEIP